MSDWQPIETAPRDIYIHVYHPAWKWRGLNGIALGFCHSDYNGHSGVWTLDGRAGVIPRETPTHWMPLPSPPKTKD